MKFCSLPASFHASLVYLLLSTSFPHSIFLTLHCSYIFFCSIICSGLKGYVKHSSQHHSAVKLFLVMHHCLVHVSGDHGCKTMVCIPFYLVLPFSHIPGEILINTDFIYRFVILLSLLYRVLMFLLGHFDKFVHNQQMNRFQRSCCCI